MSENPIQSKQHQKELAQVRLQAAIEKVNTQLGRNTSKYKTLEQQILEMPSGINRLKEFVKLNQLRNREKSLIKKLVELNYQLSTMEIYRIPSRDADDFDEWRVVENAEKENQAKKALEKSRDTRQRAENDKDIDR